MNGKYVVKDSLGNILREFDTYKQASNFKNNKHNWKIYERIC